MLEKLELKGIAGVILWIMNFLEKTYILFRPILFMLIVILIINMSGAKAGGTLSLVIILSMVGAIIFGINSITEREVMRILWEIKRH